MSGGWWDTFALGGYRLCEPANDTSTLQVQKDWGCIHSRKNNLVPMDLSFVLYRSFRQEALYSMKHFCWIHCFFKKASKILWAVSVPVLAHLLAHFVPSHRGTCCTLTFYGEGISSFRVTPVGWEDDWPYKPMHAYSKVSLIDLMGFLSR